MSDVEIITEHVTHLRRLDFRYGSARIREEVVQLLNREANTIMHGSYSEKTGKALLGAVGQVSRLAGSMAADIGRHSLAQRYYIQTLNLAMSAGDRLFAANMLCDMSRLTLHIGQSAPVENERLRAARQAVALARAGLNVANDKATPLLTAQINAVEARGHAVLGDTSSARASVREAERRHGRAHADGEPAWFSFYTDADLAADLGRSMRDIGEADQATRLITQAMDTYEPWRVRSRCFVQTDLAAAHLVGRDYEHAAALGRDAVRTAAEVGSTRTLDRLRALQRNVRPLGRSSKHLGDLDDRITNLLSRNKFQRTEDVR
ncbi:MAG: hypothetical protein GEV28_16910 [Actinophytocola sp.]|uniref:hypothetical protein n=1 Tax=Actinophytocola sp. TaxID=1872138 RepID=UPI00132A341A|nr:hypothetical protein [Actinophytocola sp.]MPZ81973.1 hypothetical protein [Actinophytocola sp.]